MKKNKSGTSGKKQEITSEDIATICYSLFQKKGKVLAANITQGSKSIDCKQYKKSPYYHLSVLHLLIGAYLFCEHKESSAIIQGKAG